MKKSRPLTFLLLLAGIALFAVACGSSGASDSAPPIIIESATSESTVDTVAATETDTTRSAATDEDQALAFAECMRDEGIDFPDPTVNADGSVAFSGARGTVGQDSNFTVAFETCGDQLDGASFLPGDGDLTEIEDGLLEAAQCLRDEGIDVADPDLSGGQQGNPFGSDFDPEDPATAAAIDACQDIFAGLGR